jgi:hypothetical protein
MPFPYDLSSTIKDPCRLQFFSALNFSATRIRLCKNRSGSTVRFYLSRILTNFIAAWHP